MDDLKKLLDMEALRKFRDNALNPEHPVTRGTAQNPDIFFQAKESLSDQELKAATEVDFENVVALVVTTGCDGKEIIIGGGRYVAFNANGVRSAEVAFLVEEDFHGLGLAGRILKHLAHIARQKGLSQFEAEVLPQNKAMLAVFAKSGLPMRKRQEGGIVHLTLALAPS